MSRKTYPDGNQFVARQASCEEIEQRRPIDAGKGVLWVVIPYTTPELTRAALRHVAVCSDLAVHVVVADIQVVQFPCSFDTPPINKEFSERRLRELLRETGLPGHAAMLYTRDWLEGFKRLLEPGSLVVLATQRRWWPTRERKIARSLTNAGHQVMLLPV